MKSFCNLKKKNLLIKGGKYIFDKGLWIWFMVYDSTFNNISVIWWRSVLLVEETGVPGENH